MPICVDQMCRGCLLDDECTSGVCRDDGSCELPANILYVSPNGVSAGTCTGDSPCEMFYAKSLLTAERFSVRLANGTYPLTGDFVVTGAVSNAVIVGGRGAAVQRALAGPAFDVAGATLTLRGFTLNKGVRCSNGTLNVARVSFDNPPPEVRPWISSQGCVVGVSDSELFHSTAEGIYASSNTTRVKSTRVQESATYGLRFEGGAMAYISQSTMFRNRGIGVSALAGVLTIERSLISENRGGGISSVSGGFDITNNFVVFNGDPGASPFGGVRLDSSLSGNRVQHNTITHNDCDVNYTPILAGGIYCVGAAAPNNLIANNFRGNTSLPNAQTGGTCAFDNSIIYETDPAILFAMDSLHLGSATSPAVNAGSVGSVTVDFDGDPRADGMPDLGADEFQP